MSRQEIAATLKRLRNACGLTAKEVGLYVGKSDKTVGAWENGRGQPDADTLLLLCGLYRVTDVQAEFGYKKSSTVEGDTVEDCRRVIKTCRDLDEHGKTAVLSVLDQEYSHSKNNVTPLSPEAAPIEVGNIAARGGGVHVPDAEELKDMQAVYEKLVQPADEKKRRRNQGDT